MGSTNNNNDEISIGSTDGPGDPNTSTSMSKRKKFALAVFLSMGLLALVIGLSVGLGKKNGQRSTSSANSSANADSLTLQDCLADEEAANADEDEEADDDEAAEVMDESTFSPTYSPMPDESVETRESNDAMIVDTGNRDLRGSIAIKRNASSKDQERFGLSNQSRRLQCIDLMNANMSKSAKGAKALTAPFCETVRKSCNSGTRLEGRGDVGGKARKGNVLKGSEYMQPNTLDDCQDRSNGQPNDISVQKISVKTLSNRPLRETRKAGIIISVQARANEYGESRGFVYSATDAYDPKWEYVDEFVVRKSGALKETILYRIPKGTGEKGVQAVRVRFGFNIGKGRCGGGGNGNLYADVDDLAFAVNVLGSDETDAAFEDDYIYDELDSAEGFAVNVLGSKETDAAFEDDYVYDELDSVEGADDEEADEDAADEDGGDDANSNDLK